MWKFKNDMKSMKEALLMVMLNKKLTIATLAKDIGLSRAGVDRFLQHDINLQLMTKLRICDYLERNKKFLEQDDILD